MTVVALGMCPNNRYPMLAAPRISKKTIGARMLAGACLNAKMIARCPAAQTTPAAAIAFDHGAEDREYLSYRGRKPTSIPRRPPPWPSDVHHDETR